MENKMERATYECTWCDYLADLEGVLVHLKEKHNNDGSAVNVDTGSRVAVGAAG